MIASLVPLAALRGERHFRWRGGDVSRLEGLTDGVFAIAMTLLVLSMEVPDTYVEMTALLRGLPAFAACFALFLLVWYEHLIHAGVGAVSLLIAFGRRSDLSGMIYVLVGPLQGLNGWLSGRAARLRGLES